MIDGNDASLTLFAPVLFYVLGIVCAVVTSNAAYTRFRLTSSLSIILGAASGVGIALTTLLSGRAIVSSGWFVAPFAPVTVRLDPLAAFFLLVISLAALPAAWYGIGYLDAAHVADESGSHSAALSRSVTDALLAAFLAAMTLVILSNGIFAFLLAWELMSLVSFFLVLGNGHHHGTRRAAFVYLVMTHIGSGFLFLAFLLLYRHAGSLDFAALRDAAPTLTGVERDAIFILALIGLGTKAGLIPLHVWLPRAHPAAPSHVSALMSGVMVKTAIYGMIRLVWEWAAPGASWWGGLLVIVGGVSAILGILYALMERDLKRVLAYSTVEHVGIITIALGAAIVLAAEQQQAAAALALLAALVIVLNHAIYKGLLFLVAGSVQTGTGTRDLERLGGLVKTMPRTAIAALIGSAASAALPPINGFVGEWLLFQALLQLGIANGTALLATLAGLAGAALALTGALSLASFVRLFGIGFLGQGRSDAARNAHEVPSTMQAGMALLAGLCILLGVGPNVLLRLLQPVTAELVGTTATPQLSTLPTLDPGLLQGAYAPLALVICLLVLGGLPWLIARVTGGASRTRVAPPWVCGVWLEPRMQYTATGFAKPIRLIFQAAIRPERSVDIERPASPFVVHAVRYAEGVIPVYERHLYDQGVNVLLSASHRIRSLQSGSLRAYLAYLFVTLVVVLALTR